MKFTVAVFLFFVFFVFNILQMMLEHSVKSNFKGSFCIFFSPLNA